MQTIWIVKLPNNGTFFSIEELSNNLPNACFERANRYLNHESALSYLVGRLLLKKVITKNGYKASLLEKISYSEHGKPSFEDHNFSISHSNGYVTLIFGTKLSVGIDIEKKKKIDLKLFNYLFTVQEWKSIMEANNSLERFYWYWVRKEALLKATGCSLKALKQLKILEGQGLYKGKYYDFKSFDFDADFNGVIATEEKVDIILEYLELKDLLEK